MTGGFAKEIDLNHREARSAGPFGQRGRRKRLAIRVLAITLKTVQKNEFLNGTPPERTDDILWELNSVIRTEIIVWKLSWRDLKTMWNTSSGTIRTNCFNCGAARQILWDAGKQTTASQIVTLLKTRFGSENQAERFRAELRSRK